jgi:protein arginine N-methyltransferase 1
MYSLSGHGRMMASSLRMDAYVQAVRNSVTPGSVVLDIGTGTGIFALLAAKFGARRVYAIEPSDAIQVARDMAVANGYADRIHFMQDLSTGVTLPERVDVIVSDLRGILPFFRHHIPSLVDARRRFLVPGGRLIPQRDTLWTAVVEAPDLYAEQVDSWDDQRYGLDMQAARRMVINTWWKGRVAPEQLLVEPQCWATLDYATVESPNMNAAVTWTASRAGTAHGLIVWFDATLAEGVGFSNAPGTSELVYGSAFFPWSHPVPLAAGDTVSVSMQATLVGKDYLWRWESSVSTQGHPVELKADFKQSTFFGAPLSLERLHKRAAGHVPALDEEGRIDRFILARIDGGTSLGEIARSLSAEFPERFATWDDALTHVGDLSERYTGHPRPNA